MDGICRRLTCALVIAVLSSLLGTARAQSQTTYTIFLSHAEESVDPSGRSVLTMMARGGLQGALTVVLERSDDGTVTGGEWALNVSYTEILPTAPPPDGGDGDPGESLVQRGVLKGSVTGGSTKLAGDGKIGTLDGIQLLLTGGTLAYDGVTSGTGSIDGTSIADRDASSGSFSLIF